MKKVILILALISLPLISNAQNQVDNFIGEYDVIQDDCRIGDSLYGHLESLVIRKGTSFGRNTDDTFIALNFGWTISEMNLTAFSRVITKTENGGFLYKPSKDNFFSMEHINGDKYLFHFYVETGEYLDDCTYVLNVK